MPELDKSNKDLDFTEDTQQNKTFLKEIIDNARIDTSDDGNIKLDGFITVKGLDFNPEPKEKPTFFETWVDVDPYFGPKGITSKDERKPLVYKNLDHNRIFRLGINQSKD